ncbi:hypothetical protein CBM2623_A170053 [Cupriavidus taiwanensis]|uniref:helix-turn-helix domain-containing protein n=1 Tax=Cupriavidus taiwanensis TaxID=164546 RepID=UPI000E126C22|nr:helix-turn-helix transcriptional regulator [Cupriavidus taiwanensis]SPA25915.1 hypothetical protein CBM2623_A170053 [Cupriavidus taiwanensis]
MTADEYLQHVRETRSKRLRELVATFENQYEAAEEIGLSQSFISRLIHGHEPFGEKLARQIEGNFGLEFGALDRGA